MKRIRGGSGLGDTLYIRAVVEHLLSKGEKLQVCTKFRDLFQDLPVELDDFSRHNIDILAHYSKRKEKKTNQWEDICIEAGVHPIPFRITWNVKNRGLVDRLQAAGKKILLIAAPHVPMERKDGFGKEILPDRAVFNAVCETLDDHYRVMIGGEALYPVAHDLDLTKKTSVTDLLDLGSVCNRAVGQCSFIIPTAEGLRKPLLIVWSHKVSQAEPFYVRRVVPEKVLSAPTSLHIYDNWGEERIEQTLNEFLEL